MKYIGAHISASGGVDNAPLNAQAIGAKHSLFHEKSTAMVRCCIQR